MEQPKGAKEPGKEDWMCHLNKSLYSLRQASRMVKETTQLPHQGGVHMLLG